MPRNIVICCDGTGNEFTEHNTNVGYLFERIERDTDRQVAFYEAGIGTFEPFGWRIGKPVGKALGAMFGYGVRKSIDNAYRFLMDHYQEGDRLYLFGFSRGAFVVRALAGMLHKCGLLYPQSHNLVPYAMDHYLKKGHAEHAATFRRVFARECHPQFIGVWDTVAALGWLHAFRRFENSRLNPDVRTAVQAIAIDERRRKFQPSIWEEENLAAEQTVHQVWFPGVHSDIGGGYDDRALGDITLEWMLDHAEAAGLCLAAGAREDLHPDPNGRMHTSHRGVWRLLGTHPRTIPPDAELHDSVHARTNCNADYNPPNL